MCLLLEVLSPCAHRLSGINMIQILGNVTLKWLTGGEKKPSVSGNHLFHEAKSHNGKILKSQLGHLDYI